MALDMELKNEDGVWVIRVPRPNGTVQEFRCASESQARKLMAVFSGTNTGTGNEATDRPQ